MDFTSPMSHSLADGVLLLDSLFFGQMFCFQWTFPSFFLLSFWLPPGSFLLSPDKEPCGWACPTSQAGQHMRTRGWEDSQLRSCPQNVLVALFCVKEKHCWNPVSSLFGFCLSAYFCLPVLSFLFWNNDRFTGNCKKKVYIYWKDWCWGWNSNTLATPCEELTHWKRPWCWEELGAGGEGDDRGWDGWMASSTRWTWVWVASESWWWTGRPGVLQFLGLQRVGHDWATELNWTESVRETGMEKRLNINIQIPLPWSRTSFKNYITILVIRLQTIKNLN